MCSPFSEAHYRAFSEALKARQALETEAERQAAFLRRAKHLRRMKNHEEVLEAGMERRQSVIKTADEIKATHQKQSALAETAVKVLKFLAWGLIGFAFLRVVARVGFGL